MEIGTVYGPLPMRISLGGLSVIRAGVDDDGTGVGATAAAGGAVGGSGGAGAGGGAKTTGGSIGDTTMLLGAGAAGADGAMTMPGMGELPGGTIGLTLVPAGVPVTATDGRPVGWPAAAAGDGATPGVITPVAGGASPPITAGGPPNVMLACVPM